MLHSLHEMIEDYFEAHKEKAFLSSLHEPARFYYDCVGNHHHRDHVNVHGLNGWLCLIRGWFGAQLPLLPQENDGDAFKGCSDVWGGLSDEAWEVFKRDENFGKDYEGIRALRGRKEKMVKEKKYGNFDSGREFTGGTGASMERNAKKGDSRYRKTASKFAWWFRKEFVVKRMFEVLNGEGKPEYVGFREKCEVLFPLFLQSENFKWEGGLMEFMYDDDLMHIDVERAGRWFWWLGVIKEQYKGEKLGEGEGQSIYTCCGKCGEVPLPPGRFCHKCGEKIEANWAPVSASASALDDNDDRKPAALSPSSSSSVPSVQLPAVGRKLRHVEVRVKKKKAEAKAKVKEGGKEERRKREEAKTEADAKAEVEAQSPRVLSDSSVALDADPDEDLTCPICMEVRDDILPIPHWSSIGDVSGHRMCRQCTASYGKNECPFCHEVSVAEGVLKLVREMINKINKTTGTSDPHALAALWEHWQFFEMEYSGRQGVVERVGKMVVEDKVFNQTLRKGVRQRAAWMRDAAGVIFRLHSLASCGGLSIRTGDRELLDKCRGSILETLETMECNGHHLGAAYSQALAPWLSASQGGGRGEVPMMLTVKDVGKAIVKNWVRHGRPGNARREVRERVIMQYMQEARVRVWGGEDEVWEAFYS